MTDFAALRPRTYSYLTDNNEENKLAKGTKKCYKRRLYKVCEVLNYKVCLEANQIEKEMNHLKNSKLDTGSLKGNHKK